MIWKPGPGEMLLAGPRRPGRRRASRAADLSLTGEVHPASARRAHDGDVARAGRASWERYLLRACFASSSSICSNLSAAMVR